MEQKLFFKRSRYEERKRGVSLSCVATIEHVFRVHFIQKNEMLLFLGLMFLLCLHDERQLKTELRCFGARTALICFWLCQLIADKLSEMEIIFSQFLVPDVIHFFDSYPWSNLSFRLELRWGDFLCCSRSNYTCFIDFCCTTIYYMTY